MNENDQRRSTAENDQRRSTAENDQRRSTAEDVRNGGSHNKGSSGCSNHMSKGFTVRDAPWSQSYTHNAEDFPNLAASAVQETAPQSVAVARPLWPVKRH